MNLEMPPAMRVLAFVLLLIAATFSAPASAQKEAVVEIPSRGQKIRALLIRPVNTVGSVILLAGGHGNLNIAPDGKIGWGAGNQLVRTRAEYAKAGFVVLVPDVAPDLKLPGANAVRQGARYSREWGEDIGALVGYMRRMKEPVTVVGTSRAAVTAGVALKEAEKFTRPDYMVLTAPMLMQTGQQPSFQTAIGNNPAKALAIPMLVIAHRKDACDYTNADVVRRFEEWMKGGKLELTWLDGPEGVGDPCEARSAHGFAGIDGQVVQTATAWIRARK
jgi:dienelactone hydrolase